MKRLFTLLLLALCVTAPAQTIKSLGYNTTNGEVVYSGTNPLTFTNAPAFSDSATVRTNLGLGWSALTNTNSTTFLNSILSTNSLYQVLTLDDEGGWAPRWLAPANFGGDFPSHVTEAAAVDPSAFRTAIGLGWSALTNTNAANFQGAIFAATNAAPTNTNAPTPDAWVDIQVGTNTYKLPLWQ